MKARERCIVFTGGGTGGHVYPGLAVIESLQNRWQGRIVWIGSGKKVEREAVEKAGVEFLAVPSGKFRRSLNFRNFLDIFKVFAGYCASLALLARLRPMLVFSKGGYVSVPPCMAAATLGIPVFTHESDVSPGLATRLNSRFATKILLSWSESLRFLPENRKSRAVVSGNPVRKAILEGNAETGRKFLGCSAEKTVVLVLGGSQGAQQINELVENMLPDLHGKIFIAHQTGAEHAPCRESDDWYHGFQFLHAQLPDVMAGSDIIMGRAGAGTVWESAALGKPMILIPLSGSGTRGDQVENAELLEKAGACLSFTGERATPAALLEAILKLGSDRKLRADMGAACLKALPPTGAAIISEIILNQTGGKDL